MKSRMKKLLSAVLAVGLMTAGCQNAGQGGGAANTGSTAGAAAAGAASGTLSGQLSIGTASMGGAYYPFGQAIANLVTQYSGGLTMTPEVTGGAVENCRLVASGDVDIGLTNENHAYAAVNGTDPFTEKSDLNVVARLYPSVLHIIVPEDSPINSIADLKGKRVAVGPSGGGTIAPLEAAMKAYGLTIDDIVPSYLSYSDGFTQLSDGNVDVALALAGYPASAVMEFSTTKAVKFVNIDEDKFDSIIENDPYFNKVVVPADTYGMKEDGVAIGINNVLIVRSDMNENLVYAITASIFDHLDEFAAANANAKDVTIETAREASVTIHPGAQKYFDEHK